MEFFWQKKNYPTWEDGWTERNEEQRKGKYMGNSKWIMTVLSSDIILWDLHAWKYKRWGREQ